MRVQLRAGVGQCSGGGRYRGKKLLVCGVGTAPPPATMVLK